MACFPRSGGQQASEQNHAPGSLGRAPPKSKRQEIPLWNKVLKWSHLEAFSQDSQLVKKAREEYFSKHSYNFITEGTHDHLDIFKQMATSTKLLGISIYEIQAVWSGPDKLRQDNYALRSLCKGLKFLHVVPLLESQKVMGLVGIHDPDTLCHFNGMTHCPWCGKEGQNGGTVVNHLWIVQYRLGLVCNKCNNCPTTSSDSPLLPWLAGLSAARGEGSRWTGLLRVITCRKW